MATRWGICGAGNISNDFTNALSSRPDELKVVAVASRSLEKAQKFADSHGIPKAYGSYEEMAKDPDVDVVYIGVLIPWHYGATMLFLNHGKHVLVETTIAMNPSQLKSMISLAAEKNVFIMEAVWSHFFEIYKKASEEIEKGSIGDLKMISAQLCLYVPEVEASFDKSLGGGAALCAACFPLSIIVHFLGKPDSITVKSTMMENGIDETTCVILGYDNGKMAEFMVGIGFNANNEVTFYGTKDKIKIHDPMWCPTKMTLPSGEVCIDLPVTEGKKYIYWNGPGMVHEALHVRECITAGRIESPILTWSHMETVSNIIAEIIRRLGIEYDTEPC